MSEDLRSLFLQVADLTPPERTAWFDTHGVAPEVRDEIESLLQFDGAAGQPLTECIAATARQFLGGEPVAGSRCGPFELVRLLGRGGMGAVFLAERHDGEVRQRAAIKFVRNMAPQELFLRERQVLAGLNHPGIARLFDAGHTAAGQPYMVMEYVEGEPVDVYCRNLDLRRKLELFLKIADALAYAHRNLIIHRDLKPSNILVDAAGQPKLLDFGIARMLDESADAGMTTERILTPEYASPEQVRGSAHTTATDIYSLGAVLYQLLTGRSPHAVPHGSDATVEEMVCRRDPAAPSALSPALPHDLDYIVAKALRKEPEERYPAIDAMADDIRALLESRPVRARAGNTWYRTRKYLRRHWLPVSAAAIILLLLAVGMFEVNRERMAAQHRFQQLQQLAKQILTFDGDLIQLPGATKARQKIVSVSMAYLDGLGKEARADPALARDLASGYLQLAKVQGVPSFPNLGQLPEAEASLVKAESSIQTALRPDPGEPYTMAIAAQIALLRMMVADTRKSDQTLTFAAQCAARLEGLSRGGRAPDALLGETSTNWINLANGYMNQHHFEEAVRYGRRGIEFGRKYGAPALSQAAALSLVANALRQSGDLDGALAAITESRQMIEAAPSPNDVRKASTLYSVLWRQGQILGAEASVSLGRFDDALPPLQRAFDLMDDLASKDPNDSLSRDRAGSAAHQLGDVLRRRDPGRALAVYDRGIQRQRETAKSVRARRTEARLLAHSSYALIDLHRRREAGERVSAALKILQDTRDFPAARIGVGTETADVLLALAHQQSENGETQHALVTSRNLLAGIAAAQPHPENDLIDAATISHVYDVLGHVYRRAGDAAGAEQIDARRLALWRAWQSKLPGNAFIQRQLQSSEAAQSK